MAWPMSLVVVVVVGREVLLSCRAGWGVLVVVVVVEVEVEVPLVVGVEVKFKVGKGPSVQVADSLRRMPRVGAHPPRKGHPRSSNTVAKSPHTSTLHLSLRSHELQGRGWGDHSRLPQPPHPLG